ncbi:MAG: O-antigen ligase family protein [Halothiobacillus sp.]
MSESGQAIHASVTAGAKHPRVEQLILFAVLILPVMVLFKRVPAEIAVGLTVIIGLGVAIRRQDFSWLAAEWFYAAAAVSLILLVLAPFSLNPGYSAMSAILALRWPIFAAVLIWLFVSRPRALALFEWAMLAVIGFIVIDTIIQYVFGRDLFGYPGFGPLRLSGPFAHAMVGTFTDRVWFIGLATLFYAMLRKRPKWALWVLVATSGIGALVLFLTGERAAFLTFMLGSLVVIIGILIHLPQWRRLLLAGLVAVALAAGVVAAKQPQMVQRTIDSSWQTITHLDNTVYGLNFMSAWAEFQARPWTGVGARQFMEYCNDYLPTYKAQYPKFGFETSCVIHPHNFYTGMLAEGGILAFLAFVAMVGFLFILLIRDAFHRGQPMQAYFGGAVLLTSFWPLQSSMEYFNGWTAAVIWIGVAWALARARIPFANHHA